MKVLLPLIATTLLLGLPAVHADDKTPPPPQNRMAMCNKDAGDRKGDERKQFMSQCLSNKPAPAAADGKPATQQDRMRHCNTEAKGKTGDERKQFMSQCLRNK